MFPSFSMNYCSDIGRICSKSFRQTNKTIFFRNVKGSYFSNLIFCKNIMVEFFSDRLSSFSNFILHVVIVRSYEKMRRKYTITNIAVMANKQSCRYFSYVKFIRKTMGIFFIKTTISKIMFCSCPQPTGISFIDVFPKTYFWTYLFGCIRTWPTSFIAPWFKEWFITIRTVFVRIVSHRESPFLGVIPRTFSDVAGFSIGGL